VLDGVVSTNVGRKLKSAIVFFLRLSTSSSASSSPAQRVLGPSWGMSTKCKYKEFLVVSTCRRCETRDARALSLANTTYVEVGLADKSWEWNGG
jgi:hypothetical protein